MNSIVSGLMCTYSDRGNGPVIVALHGWGDTAQTYTNLSDALADSYRVVALDLPGFGGTSTPANAWSLDDYAAFVAAFLHKLNITDYTLLGHSNGGAIAIQGTGTGTLRPKALILLASSGIRPPKTLSRLGFVLLAKVGKAISLLLPIRYRALLRKKLYRAAGSDALVVPALQETFTVITRQDVRLAARAIQVPTLLINGGRDTDVTLKQADLLHNAIPGSRIITLPAAGHFVQHDEPIAVEHAIREFM